MEKMKDLKDLLQHELQDLYSVEEQIIAAMPAMIEKAKNETLKQALQQHLKITFTQKERLDKIQSLMGEATPAETTKEGEEKKKGLLARLFSKGKQKCLGMEGIIKEGEKILNEDMDPDVLEAAIVACAQKIEHYEICGYGTARAYAQELALTEVEALLAKTLAEEYETDDRLTQMAMNRLNINAEAPGRNTQPAKTEGSKTAKPAVKSTAKKTTTTKKAAPAKKAATKTSAQNARS